VDGVNAGLAMIEKAKQLFESGQVPEIKLGIGLHSGNVIAGELGNEFRKAYSITGSNVIIAARIEQLNKKLESQFLISESVYKNIKDKVHEVTFQGSHELKGISEPVNIYQLA